MLLLSPQTKDSGRERGWEKGRKPVSHKKASLMNRGETVMYFSGKILTGLPSELARVCKYKHIMQLSASNTDSIVTSNAGQSLLQQLPLS